MTERAPRFRLSRCLAAASAVLSAAAVASTGCTPKPSWDSPVRHVVLISLDTARADQFGLYGNTEVATPNLDRLASESIVLDELMTVAPTTLASHASLFSGKYPHSHGTPRNGFVINEQNVMLPELLRELGFTTAGFAASFALDSRFGLAQGFDHYDERLERSARQDRGLQNERSAESVTDAAIDYLDREGVPDHLFLFAHYFDPHVPYAAPAPYDTMYDPRGRQALPDWLEVSQRCSRDPGQMTEVDERMALQYASEISYMDHHVGRLLDDLRRRGILEQALLVVTSDHGENLWEHRACYDHGWTTYQTTMRVLGLVRLPGAANAGARIDRPLTNVDILPSVLGYLGIPVPEGADGAAFDLAAPSSPAPPRAVFGQATKPWKQVETDPRWTNMLKARYVREGRYKLIQVPYAGREELYDLVEDPQEQHDLLAAAGTEDERRERDALVRRLRSMLEAWAASADPLPSRFETSHQDETIERLKSLGYLGGS